MWRQRPTPPIWHFLPAGCRRLLLQARLHLTPPPRHFLALARRSLPCQLFPWLKTYENNFPLFPHIFLKRNPSELKRKHLPTPIIQIDFNFPLIVPIPCFLGRTPVQTPVASAAPTAPTQLPDARHLVSTIYFQTQHIFLTRLNDGSPQALVPSSLYR